MRTRIVLCSALALGLAAFARAQLFQITSKDGQSSLRLGLLSQTQAEWLDTADATETSQNLFERRFRLLFGGKWGDKLTFFVDTDTSNIGKAAANGTKGGQNVDVVMTYTFAQQLKLDAGQILVPDSHNSQQGATTLLAVDYGPYSFNASAPTGSKTGRDWGLQARGYLLGNHLEYRAGVFQGARGANSTMPFRYVGRVVYYPFDAEPDFFYTGTTFGKKHILGIGVSYDGQQAYHEYAGDVFLDQPVAGGDALTLQADYLRFDGGSTFTSLPAQKTWLGEASYFLHAIKLAPFVQYAKRTFDSGAPRESQTQGGLAYWASGHQLNLKAAYARITKEHAPKRNQAVLQLQVFLY